MRSRADRPRRRPPAVGTLALLATAAALLAAGCGGSDESPQERWAADVCGALSDFKSSMT
jgi:hypothetical protein